MSLPFGNTGSLCSGFPPDRPVCLPVKRPYAITLCGRLPIVLRAPLEASVTLLEATTPVKLPAKQCPRIRGLELKQPEGRISTAAPRGLASPLHGLRPILHTGCPSSMLSYSKGSRGLFVTVGKLPLKNLQNTGRLASYQRVSMLNKVKWLVKVKKMVFLKS